MYTHMCMYTHRHECISIRSFTANVADLQDVGTPQLQHCSATALAPRQILCSDLDTPLDVYSARMNVCFCLDFVSMRNVCGEMNVFADCDDHFVVIVVITS